MPKLRSKLEPGSKSVERANMLLMSDSAFSSPHQLLRAARDGESAALGKLLESYRNYLYLLASSRIRGRLALRASPSDVVQETFVQACASFPQFRGTSEAEFLVWLRKVLATRLARLCERHVSAEKRDIRREVSWEEICVSLDRSTARLQSVVLAKSPSPGTQFDQREQAVVIADLLAALPDDYREVLVLRHVEGLPFPEVADKMGRSHGAVRMLWMRAIEVLRKQLQQAGLV
jgi:RNA polymerase sigma-70 factor (ECF subfamily)